MICNLKKDLYNLLSNMMQFLKKYKDYIFFLLLIFFFFFFTYKCFLYQLNILQELWSIEHQQYLKVKLYNEFVQCIKHEWIYEVESQIIEKKDIIASSDQLLLYSSDEFQRQWCLMPKSEIHNFCKELINNPQFSLEFKKDVIEALRWVLVQNLNKGHDDCMVNLLRVQDIYNAWAFINNIK